MKDVLDKVVEGSRAVAIICNQWGDTGKGKFSNLFAKYWADVVVRGTGGNNAGHTVVINGKKRIFHLLPTGIIYDKDGKINILGNGMVLDLKVLCTELAELDKERISYDKLMISEDANVIMPYHISRDLDKDASSKKGGIGSTGKGIGPCYTDKIARRGIFVRDLLKENILKTKLEKVKSFYPKVEIDSEKIISDLKPFIEKIKPFVKDTITEINDFYSEGKKILIEGAQGLLLSIEYGTYPYVTSSDPSLNGTATGTGLCARNIYPLGIVKFPFMTRVGGGPFPSELGGEESENYCAEGLEHDIKFELDKYKIPFEVIKGNVKYNHSHPNIISLMNSKYDFEKGIGIRLAAEEYGATTGRPRRTGWTDLPALKFATYFNGMNIILTKVDAISGAKKFSLVESYGEEKFSRDCDSLRFRKPIFKEFEGFEKKISDIKAYDNLPNGLKDSIDFLEKTIGAKVKIVSVGPDQNETIVR